MERRNEDNFSEDDEENQETEMSQQEKDDTLMSAVKAGDLDLANEMLQKQAKVTTEKDGWTPLLWAACNGNEQMVRLLIRYQACTPFMQNQQEDEQKNQHTEETHDPFVPPKDPQKYGRFYPLHWASYKGHYKVVWILLKEDMSPLDIDMHGNTSVHQAAASGSIKVLSCFLQRGVNVLLKNARGHTPLDLTTNEETRALIQKATKTVKCTRDGSVFDFKNIRYYCEACQKFFCGKCSQRNWVFETVKATDKERPVCRCTECQQDVENSQKELEAALDTREFAVVDKALTQILNDNIDIDVKLKHSAEVMHLKLEKELDIRDFSKSVAHVDNYKTILKSVKILNDKWKAAEEQGVQLDSQLIQDINNCSSRLISERDLRFQMDNIYVSGSTHKSVDDLKNLINKAHDTNVEQQYMEQASKLSSQMTGNIQAREILQMLQEYPERVYPESEPVDAKGKPVKKKDDKPKKRKKKEPPFDTPDWATELDDVRKQVNMMSELANDASNLHLEQEFLDKVKEQLLRFKKEMKYRQDKLDEAAYEAEQRALNKKKKKK